MNMPFIPVVEHFAPTFQTLVIDTNYTEISDDNHTVGFTLCITGLNSDIVYINANAPVNDTKSSTICNSTNDPQNDVECDFDSYAVSTNTLCTVEDCEGVIATVGMKFTLTEDQAGAINEYLEGVAQYRFEQHIANYDHNDYY